MSSSRLRSDQSGLASIAIIMIIIIILTTIVIGFAQVIRREQRRSLDRQLSSQAYYAAESGVNDAVKAIKGGFSEVKSDCAPYSSTDASKPPELKGNSNLLTADRNVQYSCLLIDPSPESLVFDNVKVDRSNVFPIETSTNVVPDSIYISWQDKDDPNGASFRAPGDNYFPTQAAWLAGGPSTGILRVDIVPVAASNTRDSLIAASRTFFLYPNSNGTRYSISENLLPPAMSPSFGGTQSGEIVRGHCKNDNLPNKCVVRIQGINSAESYVRVRSIYRPTTIEVIATDSSNNFYKLINAQTMVDSTGKVANVSRRIQVRVPVLEEISLPEQVLGSMNTLCKKFTIIPQSTYSDIPGEPTCEPTPS